MPKRTILIVEDETLIRMTVSDYLQDNGFKTLEAAHGDEAKEILRATAVGLVLTDIRMAGAYDGIDLAKWVDENRPGVPVVLLSGSADLVQRELERGRCALLKPVNYDAMLKIIRSLLSASGPAE